MPRHKLLELKVTVADSTGARVRTLRFLPGGGPGPDDMDLDKFVAMYWGQAPTQTPLDLLGGFYHHHGMPHKADQVDLLWNGSAQAIQGGQGAPELPAMILKEPSCDPDVYPAP